MKILLIAENWPPRVGGIERYLTGLTGALSETSNVSVTVVVPQAKRSILGPGDDELSQGQFRIIRKRFLWPFIKPAWLPLYIFIYLLAAREKFDLVLCGKGLFEGLAGYYLKRRLGISYVVFTYYMEVNEWAGPSGTRRKLKRVLANADLVIIIADALRRTIESLGARPDAIVKIHPAVSEEFLQRIAVLKQGQEHLAGSRDDSALGKWGIQKPYILTVARLIPRKGIDDLIRAYAKLDQTKFGDVQLIIVGDGPERSRLEQIAASEYVRPQFLGEIPDEDLPALFASAKLFALTPKEIEGDVEGFGIVYLEAAAAGIPTVGTRTGGVPEAVEDGKTGLLARPGDVADIAEALAQLLSDGGLGSRLGQSGRERVLSQLRWRLAADSLLDRL